jgi:hypothetical protein
LNFAVYDAIGFNGVYYGQFHWYQHDFDRRNSFCLYCTVSLMDMIHCVMCAMYMTILTGIFDETTLFMTILFIMILGMIMHSYFHFLTSIKHSPCICTCRY